MVEPARSARVKSGLAWKLLWGGFVVVGAGGLIVVAALKWRFEAPPPRSEGRSLRAVTSPTRSREAVAPGDPQRAGTPPAVVGGEEASGRGELPATPTAVAAALRARRFDALEALLRDLVAVERADPFRGETPALLAFEAFASADPELEAVAREWIEGLPDSPYPHLLLASHWNARAWEARGHRFAASTTQAAFAEMSRWKSKAIPEARLAVRLEPVLAQGWIVAINLSLGEPRECLRAADGGLGELPRSFRIRAALMNCFRPRWSGSYAAMDALAAEAQRGVERNPNLRALRGFAAQDRADLAARRGDLDAAARLADEAIAEGGRYWRFLTQKASVLSRRRENSAALALIEEAMTSSPDLPELLEDRLAVLLDLERSVDARADLARLAFIDPRHGNLDHWRRRLTSSERRACEDLVRARDDAAAVERCREVAEALPEDADAHYWHGMALMYAKSYEPAIEALERSVALRPRSRDAILSLDWLYGRKRKWPQVMALWDAYLELEPNDARALLERAGTHRRLGDEAAGCRDLAKACALGNAKACTIAGRDCGEGDGRE